ncbi:7432_t:CDS:2, partial [Acaulospora morrowiae]
NHSGWVDSFFFFNAAMELERIYGRDGHQSMLPLTNEENTTTQFLKVDLRICQFSKSRNHFPASTLIRSREPNDMVFLFRFNQNAVSLCLNSMRDEIVIPFDQLVSFKVSSSLQICMKLKQDFNRVYLRRERLATQSAILKVEKDPTGGLLDGTLSILLTHNVGVCPQVLYMIEAGINKLWFDRFGVVNEMKVSSNCPSLNICCYLSNQAKEFSFPKNENLFHFIVYLKGYLKYPLKKLKYKTKKGEIVPLRNESDWESAKSVTDTDNHGPMSCHTNVNYKRLTKSFSVRITLSLMVENSQVHAVAKYGPNSY